MDYKNNGKYLGITIGPIIRTLSFARKPRELWSASYLFSFMMRTLIKQVEAQQLKILSPDSKSTIVSVGLYPDRLYCRYDQDIDIQKDIISVAKKKFTELIGLTSEYFNIWTAVIFADSEGEAICKLNNQLDLWELQNMALNNNEEDEVLKLISKKEGSPLFLAAFQSPRFEVESLSEIATAQLKKINKTAYQQCVDNSRKQEKDVNKDMLIEYLRPAFPETFKTFNKYICVVHADGDNIGSIISKLSGDEVKALSESLLKFGIESCKAIKNFGGLPIYAGGDDLLFISPVVSNDQEENEITIFDLIGQIDDVFEKTGIKNLKKKNEEGEDLAPSLSYGISITYYKYPLYEALALSRELLFGTAKKIKGKNALAWTLQKGSGFSVSGGFSKKENGLSIDFYNLLKSIDRSSVDGNFITAVIHKIRNSSFLLKMFLDSEWKEQRLDAFFVNTLEYDLKKEREKKYLDAVKNLLIKIYDSSMGEAQSKVEKILKKDDLPGKGSDISCISRELVEFKLWVKLKNAGSESLEKTFDEETKLNDRPQQEQEYLIRAKEYLPEIKEIYEDMIVGMTENNYSMLRTAKFIKGLEEDKDE